MSNTGQSYSIGQQVIGTVEKVLPFGIFLRLEDGTRAYIRRRELSLAGDVHPSKIVAEGDKLEAVVISFGELGQSMELSHKKTLPDPWERFASRYRAGDTVVATVKKLTTEGVFVQIAPGIRGFISLSEIASWKVERPEEVVWKNDRVEAVITHIDVSRQKIQLSIRQWQQRLGNVEMILERIYQTADEEPAGEVWPEEDEGFSFETEPPDDLEAVGWILVVDDYEVLREQLVKWLTDQGCLVHGASTATEAIKYCQEQEYELVLADLDLGESEMDGMTFIRKLRSDGRYSMDIAVMSDPFWIEEHLLNLQALAVSGIFPKPLELDDVWLFICRLARGENIKLERVPTPNGIVAETVLPQDLIAVMRSRRSLTERIQQGLEQLVGAVGAEQGIVFNLDSISKKVSIIAQVGSILFDPKDVYSLEDSPVKDVILEEDIVWEDQVSKRNPARFRKLLDIFPFETCIGFPIRAGGQIEHALFLFHRESRAIPRPQYLGDVRSMASLFAVALESAILDNRVQQISNILLNGQLAAGFGHEIYNKLPALELLLRNARSDFERLEIGLSLTNSSFDLGAIKLTLIEALETTLTLKKTVIDFRRLLEVKTKQVVDVKLAINQAKALIQPQARRANVEIRLASNRNLPATIGSSIGLQQVFLNLMLNAVQQMEIKPESHRVLMITADSKAEEESCSISLRFTDTGPGIHRQLWEEIFDLGFTTRSDGSGLGLYIARSLIESMGGRVFVGESLVPLGTTFVVELPARAEDIQPEE